MPKFKNPRGAAREEQAAGNRPHTHKHQHEAGDKPHEHTFITFTEAGTPGSDLPHHQPISGAGPDAGSENTAFDAGFTAPHGSSGFTLSQHMRCITPEQNLAYYTRGVDALPDECRRGHAPR